MFSFWRKKGERKPPKTAKAAPTQKRSAFRMPVEFDVFYTLRNRTGRRHARANDLSAGGLRLSADEDLIKGSMLELDFRLPDDFLEGLTIEKEVFEQTPFGLRPETVKTQPPPFEPMRLSAEVLSTFYVPGTRRLAHGMKFVNLTQESQEELQRFVHLWQLHQIRLRAEANR
ncbi:MAG TPA: PilZ domain-containing protein [Candidatus Aquilonibacter sp.]|nr:PilZ domain-containing protein [Candidatus Aquilonibacter sp.]